MHIKASRTPIKVINSLYINLTNVKEVKMFKTIKKSYLHAGIILITSASSIFPVLADDGTVRDVGEGAARVGQMSNAMLNGVLATAGFIGALLFLYNGWKLFFGGDQGQETKGKQFRGLMGGAFLSTPLIYLAMFTTTFSGADATQTTIKDTISTYQISTSN